MISDLINKWLEESCDDSESETRNELKPVWNLKPLWHVVIYMAYYMEISLWQLSKQ